MPKHHTKVRKSSRKLSFAENKRIFVISAFIGTFIVIFAAALFVQLFFKTDANTLKQIIVHHSKPVCGTPQAKSARCSAHVVTNDSLVPQASSTPPSSALTPTDLHVAYNLPCTPGGSVQSQCATPTAFGPIIAIVDAYHTPTLENDLNVFSAQYGLPSCTQANGCLQIVDENGGTNLPTTVDQNWSLEASLDVQTVHAICQTCKILFVEAASATFLDLATGVNTAARLGAKAITNSYGAGEFSGETSYDSYYNHPGIAVTASSGDGGYGATYPAASTGVIGVGGTTLQVYTNGAYGGETGWSGAGSGCSIYETALSNQVNVSNWSLTGCGANKGIADVSADADPNTGVAVYDSTPYSSQTGWWQVGGTSLSSPIVATIFALANATVPTNTQVGSILYQNNTGVNFHDILSGSNGTCGSIMCTGATGYDGPTGLGTLNGIGGFGGTPISTATPTPTPLATPTPVPPQAWVTTGGYIYLFNEDGTTGGPYINSSAYYTPMGDAVVGNQVWTANTQFGGSISRYDYTGALVAPQLTGNGLNYPIHLAVVGTQVWVTNDNINAPTNSVSRFNTDGTSAGTPLTGNGLCSPGYLAVVGNQVWVGNTNYNSCGTQTVGTISRFNFDGTSAGSVISGNGLSNVQGIAVVGTQVWVANFFNNNISVFNFNGTPAGSTTKTHGKTKTTATLISGNGLNHPSFIAVVGNQVWVGNEGNYTISRFNSNGTSAGTPIAMPGTTIPYDLTVVPQH